MDEDDEFLYGNSSAGQTRVEKALSSNGVSHSEEEGVNEDGEGEEESEDDIEFITEPTARSIDFRRPGYRAPAQSTGNRGAAPSLTTEYTPHERSKPTAAVATTTTTTPTPTTPTPSAPVEQAPSSVEDDPSALAAVTAPPSHPTINPSVTGVLDGRSILEFDLGAMAEKPWRRPGSDISDWFNYGFDEISWEAYCYRRRDLGEVGNALKGNVLNFAGMPEDQLTALPAEVRQMVMTGATAMMSGGGMMDMSGMNTMNMGIIGMNGEMMPEVLAAPEEFNGGMTMGMGEFGIQEPYQSMESNVGRGVVPGPYRSRGAMRGRGFQGRGRGRGMYGGDGVPLPVRPASPLPPGVPTGPRNQNKYKDRDGNAPAVDGLDYGGGRTPSGESESRKRKNSPSSDETRLTKRR